MKKVVIKTKNQIRRKKVTADAIALQKVRPQRFQQPKTVADNDVTLADSGGTRVGVANLSLPGDFAFETFETEVTSNGITTSLQTMQPRDPSLQNTRREASTNIGNVTVSVSNGYYTFNIFNSSKKLHRSRQ